MLYSISSGVFMEFKMDVFANSIKGLPIFKYEFGNNGNEVLILGGVHGDEPEGVIAAQGLLKSFLTLNDLNLKITLIPEFNIEGILNKQRHNCNGIDLNRNLPTRDWTSEVKNPRYFPGHSANSEPENQALVKLLDQRNYKLLISLHSFTPMINVNGSGWEAEAEILKKLTGYPIETDIGYPTPGSLGTLAGKERNIPTITFEIERDIDFKEINKIHVPAILAALKATEKK